MNQEVKVGQIWVHDVTGLESKVDSIVGWWVSIGEGGSITIPDLREYYTLKGVVGSHDSFPHISLRDHFAGLAMQAMMNAPIGKFSHKSTDEIAIGAYRAADEMIKARGE